MRFLQLEIAAGLTVMKFLRKLDYILKPQIALAHCDIPCGIYETNTLLMAAHTVQRMVEVIDALPVKPSNKDHATLIRCVKVKEDHAQICKQQLLILWADFFKLEHLEKFPDLHDKVWKAMKLCSDNKHEISAEKAKQLEETVSEIAEMFDEVKVVPKEDHQGTISDNPDVPKKKLLAA